MFASVLIANRGEIACRIARTARRLGMRVIAVYSAADKDALHVRLADEAHPVGPAPARESYLAIDRIIEAARNSSAQCIHPGYGFLSENAEFAEACARAGPVFVGPPAAAVRAMGLKDRAKALMEKSGVPVVPGYHGEKQEVAFLKQQAAAIGYPVLIKAVAGGGGKGMRLVPVAAEFERALESAQREAQSAFGDARVLIEKYIAAPRHIEVQVFADSRGNVIHLNERDCSLQRRHQKVIEEAPAPGMTPAVRAAIGAAAVRAAKAVGYAGAGTVEFIADGAQALSADRIWFLEMNTRLQVEHPVTEAVTGLDLVEWQFRVAAGEPLPLSQAEVPLQGHAVEARIYAEDPAHGFLPSTGKILALDFPKDVRVDTGVEAGSDISPFYDPMIAKMIAHAPTRAEALSHLAEALDLTTIAGPRNNVALLASLCRSEDFRAGKFDTGYIERSMAALVPQGIDRAAAAVGAAELLARERARIAEARDRPADEPASPWDAADGFLLNAAQALKVPIVVDGGGVMTEVKFAPGGLSVSVDGIAPASGARTFAADDAVHVLHKGRQTIVRLDAAVRELSHGEGDGRISAPMHGRLLALLVGQGDKVAKGQRLAIVEAMKMEHTLTAPFAGTVSAVNAVEGAQVAEGAPIVSIEPEGNEA